MKYILQLLLLTSAFSAFSQKSSFEIQISQGGQTYEIADSDEALVLEPEQFVIHMEFNKTEGIYVSASLTDKSYNKPPESEWLYIDMKVMSEEDFNEEKDIIISNDYFCYWSPNKGQDWHRLDKPIKTKGKKTYATYTVEKLYTEDKVHVPLTEVDGPLYLLFFSIDDNTNKDIERRRVKIQFAQSN
ncbi:hypothetical protein JMN32_08735 [Fulvivirga sp. 29W222]|uniref:Uncharacterized protein n=1 Tax=Fulvivirga marina TaxID=2494733 RepID=A0A937FXS5_9BACT|nr:hypothetical protein [Fulvivirga marina]MBL6446391.1 hypothetical protein [Fulvivirga marina]